MKSGEAGGGGACHLHCARGGASDDYVSGDRRLDVHVLQRLNLCFRAEAVMMIDSNYWLPCVCVSSNENTSSTKLVVEICMCVC